MLNILFICHGNICRSTMAEFMFRNMVRKAGREKDFLIESAATSREEIGNDIHPGTKKKLQENGIPYERHYARQMSRTDYNKFDYLIGMDDANVRNIIRIAGGDPEKKVFKLLDFAGEDRSIADPWYTGNFDETYDDILTGLQGLFRELL
ncbi:low molecular weight protein-tyrosine-phosphatase [Hornefia butyriciproducens]|uniref:low molecular weight protein-tyrosine-phosphatase n=1 Tax=Hornefia butyriciproducens TaxID=2652293 RepID=UPI002A90A7A2|nr:low molecular weight protein-tyrosine-phosphatase [Hornefia butyriciproducens]MDY5462776.1 low molecular weight protein-tyrosine-phosphatase [Hornefia butyriciproducens]